MGETSTLPSGALGTAQIYLNPAKTMNGPSGPVSALDPFQPNYNEALIGLFAHELGHTMGLDDVPVSDPTNLMTCGGQTRGNSIMNAFCGVNNQGWDLQGGSQASNFTDCDQQSISNYYSPPPEGGEDWIPYPPQPHQQCWEIWEVWVIYQWTPQGWVETARWYGQYVMSYCMPLND